jgi:hypothetical protein
VNWMAAKKCKSSPAKENTTRRCDLSFLAFVPSLSWQISFGIGVHIQKQNHKKGPGD